MMITSDLNSIKFTPLLDTLKLQKIEDEEYFSAKFSGYISNSRLSLINPNQDNDTDGFFAGLSKFSKYSDALILGSAVHELTLQPEYFELNHNIDRPTAKMGFMCDFLYNILKSKGSITDSDIIAASDEINYYKGKMNSDRIQAVKNAGIPYWKDLKGVKSDKTQIYFDEKNRNRVLGCVKALADNKNIQELLHPEGILDKPISENEQAILLDVKVDIPNINSFVIRLKSKLDNYTINLETNEICVNDVKTIGKTLDCFDGVDGNWDRFHYYRELAMYSWLLSLVAKKYYNLSNPKISANCLVVSTIPKYYTKVYNVNKAEFIKGWNELIYLLKLVVNNYDKYKENSVFCTT